MAKHGGWRKFPVEELMLVFVCFTIFKVLGVYELFFILSLMDLNILSWNTQGIVVGRLGVCYHI